MITELYKIEKKLNNNVLFRIILIKSFIELTTLPNAATLQFPLYHF